MTNGVVSTESEQLMFGQGMLSLAELADVLEGANLEEDDLRDAKRLITDVTKWFRGACSLTPEGADRLMEMADEVNMRVEQAERAAGWDPTP